MLRFLSAVLCCVMLAACASTSTLEPQGQALKAGNARIYVIRPDMLATKFMRYDVVVDERDVGKVASGSYIAIDRPPGVHKVRVTPLIKISSAEHEFTAEAGRSYYFVINAKATTAVAVSGSFVMAIPIPGSSIGQPSKERNYMAGIYIGILDETAGRDMIARMGSP